MILTVFNLNSVRLTHRLTKNIIKFYFMPFDNMNSISGGSEKAKRYPCLLGNHVPFVENKSI